jgi:hypothetical protein
MGIVNTMFEKTAGRESHLSFFEAEPELYIVNSFRPISNPYLKPHGLRAQN